VLTAGEVCERVDELRSLNEMVMPQRARIRAIMNGGAEAIKALLGGDTKLKSQDLPIPPLFESGLSKLAQRVGRRPDCKVDPRADRDSQKERARTAKRQRIVHGLDELGRLEMQLPQVGRWLPGYGFAVWTIKGRTVDGYRYPWAELRDPSDCYPAAWGPDQQPDDIAIVRAVSERWLTARYPEFGMKLQATRQEASGRIYPDAVARTTGWEGQNGAIVIVEYICDDGSYLVVPEHQYLLAYAENLLASPAFVVAKRFAFDALVGQYDHSIALMAMMAKFNILSLIATEDSVFRETNIIGEMTSKRYRRGRFATNFFEVGSRIERPQGDIAFQTFQQIDRIERQLRTGTQYPATQDAQPPGGWVTGQGLERLGQDVDNNVHEYHLALRYALQDIDAKRLEWDEVYYPKVRKSISSNIKGVHTAESYVPAADIHGNYRTRRVYGVMAGWDEPSKIVTGLQLQQGKLLDRQTIQENLEGLENVELVNERIRKDEAEDALLEMLHQRALNGDPAATMALVQIHADPKDTEKILAKFFTPEGDQPTPGEAQMAAGGQAAGGTPQNVQTILSRLEQSGNVAGGAQTVGVRR